MNATTETTMTVNAASASAAVALPSAPVSVSRAVRASKPAPPDNRRGGGAVADDTTTSARVHKTLGTAPAVAAGVTDHVWSWTS